METAGVGELVVEVVVMVVMVRMLLLLYPDVPQVPVLTDELVHSPVQLLDPGALRLDEALLVLHDGGELPQVQDRLHRVFQQAGAHHIQDEWKGEIEGEEGEEGEAGLADGGQRRCTISVSAGEKVRCPSDLLSSILLGCG